MYHVSNHILAVLNISTLLVSIPIMVVSTSLKGFEKSECLQAVRQPMLVIGIVLFIVSLMGIVGSCFRFAVFLWIYLFVLLMLMIGLFCFTIFVYIVTDRHIGVAIEDTGFMQYRVSDYSNWLQRQLGDDKRWADIKSCLQEGDTCARPEYSQDSPPLPSSGGFLGHDVTPIQAGCCRPHPSCGFTSNNETKWIIPEGAVASLQQECKLWNNDPHILCYDCEACRAGVLDNLRENWRKFTVASFFILVILNVIYGVGCCAYRNIKLDRYRNRIYYY